MYEDIKINNFTKAYLNAALASSRNEGIALEETFDLYDIDENHLVQVKEDCLEFQTKYGGLLAQAYQNPHYSEQQAGTDLWLSRNGESFGFKERGLGQIGLTLCEKSEELGPSEAYVNEDKKINFTNLPFDRRQLRFKF